MTFALKHLGLVIYASSGAATPDETREAFGAFLLAGTGYPVQMATVTEPIKDETFVFTYKGKVWRFSFILVFDMQLGKPVPFRIHFDYIKGITDE